ncbi:MAG TPA: protein-disulfide reductase DsbD N-terminal domain-containing protein, partial [Burkholderiaceae bacterium]|nr:protein-disulfide reductase DsbD N-terminal domain-containing protein [Burkholderiaceae bacterium]
MNQIEPSFSNRDPWRRFASGPSFQGRHRAIQPGSHGLLLQLLTLLLVLVVGRAHAADDFLEPDQAFRLSARAADGATLELRYEIAPGYYMYRERFEVVAAPADVKLGAPAYPAGKVKYDETFQKDVETFRGDLRIPVPVTAAPAEFKVTVTSQGCADKGLCYPPRPQVLKVQVADAAIRSVTLLGDDEGQAWQPAAAAAIPLVAGAAAPVVAPGAADGGAAAVAGDGV